MKVKAIIDYKSKHISKNSTYIVKDESEDGRYFLVTNDKGYVSWVNKCLFMDLS